MFCIFGDKFRKLFIWSKGTLYISENGSIFISKDIQRCKDILLKNKKAINIYFGINNLLLFLLSKKNDDIFGENIIE